MRCNKIKDILPLKQYHSNNLKTLFWLDNSIDDITPLEKINTLNLEKNTLGSEI